MYIKAILTLTVIAACKTTGHVQSVNKQKGELSLYSADQKQSALASARSVRGVNQSIENLRSAIKRNPRDVQASLNLAELYLAQERLDEAESACRQAIRFDLKNSHARVILSQVAIRRGQTDLADIILNGIDEKVASKDSQVQNLRALIALNRGQNGLAMSHFKDALRANPGDIAVRMNLGVLLVEYNRLAAAAVQFERVLASVPDHPDARMHMAVIYANRGDHDSARDIYEDVLARQSDHPIALYNMAVLAKHDQDYDESLSFLDSYLKSKRRYMGNSDQVFALIEDIKDRQAANHETSDKEIQALAAQVKQDPNEKVAVKSNAEPRPVTKTSVTPAAVDDELEEIDALERELQ